MSIICENVEFTSHGPQISASTLLSLHGLSLFSSLPLQFKDFVIDPLEKEKLEFTLDLTRNILDPLFEENKFLARPAYMNMCTFEIYSKIADSLSSPDYSTLSAAAFLSLFANKLNLVYPWSDSFVGYVAEGKDSLFWKSVTESSYFLSEQSRRRSPYLMKYYDSTSSIALYLSCSPDLLDKVESFYLLPETLFAMQHLDGLSARQKQVYSLIENSILEIPSQDRDCFIAASQKIIFTAKSNLPNFLAEVLEVTLNSCQQSGLLQVCELMVPDALGSDSLYFLKLITELYSKENSKLSHGTINAIFFLEEMVRSQSIRFDQSDVYAERLENLEDLLEFNDALLLKKLKSLNVCDREDCANCCAFKLKSISPVYQSKITIFEKLEMSQMKYFDRMIEEFKV